MKQAITIMKTNKSLPTSVSNASCNEDGEATQVSSAVVMMTTWSFAFTYLGSNVFAIIRWSSKEKQHGHRNLGCYDRSIESQQTWFQCQQPPDHPSCVLCYFAEAEHHQAAHDHLFSHTHDKRCREKPKLTLAGKCDLALENSSRFSVQENLQVVYLSYLQGLTSHPQFEVAAEYPSCMHPPQHRSER